MNQSYRNIKVLYSTFLIIVLMLPQVLQSQQLLKTSQSINIYDLCATSIMTPVLLENARLNTLRLYPDIAEAELERPDWLKKGLTAAIGDSLQFWAFNIRQKTSYRIWAELRATGSAVAIWVEKDELKNGTVTDDFVAELDNIFENTTPAGSINSSSGLIPIERELFGNEPNKDGDGKTDILLLDIQDFYDGDKNRTFVSGFFNPNDQRDNSETGIANSNERELLYLDTNPAIAQKAMFTTASHEYQHLIHYNYDQSETNLINEGASQLAQIVTGFTWDNPGSFFNDTDR